MLKALAQYQEATGDPRVIPLMDRYFAYQLEELPGRPLRDWGKFRWQDEAAHRRSGSTTAPATPYLLDLARLLHQQGYDWMAQYAEFPITSRRSLRNSSS